MNLRKLMKWGFILIVLLAYRDFTTDTNSDNRELAGVPSLELTAITRTA